MKKLITFIVTSLLFVGAFAQSNFYIESKGTTAPYSYNATGSDIITTGNQVLSSWQALPFSWTFYGQAVTGYFASDNGYITFDNSATTSYQNNVAVPNAGGPNNAIYGFWDDFTVDAGSGNPDVVRNWTYGTAPNRTHCIQWWSMTPTGSTAWLYMTIRIHENGDFDIIHDYATSAAANATDGTVGCEDASGANGTNLQGGPNLDFPSAGSGGSDDIVYTFKWTTNQYDVSVIKAFPCQDVVIKGNNTITGTLANYGPTPITSLKLYYKDGNKPANVSILSGLNIAANGGTYEFTHNSAWNVQVPGVSHDIHIWAESLNGSNPDEDTSNDTLTSTVFSINGNAAPKNVLLEEYTGAWCGWCPDGAVLLEQLVDANAGRVVGVSIHDNDAMAFSDGIRTAFNVTSFPGGQVDRFHFSGEDKVPHSRSKWTSNVAKRLSETSPVGLTLESTYNSTTRAVSVDVTAEFVDFYAGDIRIALMVVEDSLTGSGSQWNQVNYLNTQNGHTYFGAGNPIVGFMHRHVLREMPNGLWGNAGVIPNQVNSWSSYTENFSFTLNAGYKDNDVTLVAYIYNYYEDASCVPLHNVVEGGLGETITATATDITNSSIKVFPNPMTSLATIEATFASPTHASFELFNTMGQKIAILKEGDFSAGKHAIYMDANSVPGGVYFVIAKTDLGNFTQKIIVNK